MNGWDPAPVYDPKVAAAVTAVRTRLEDRSSAILEDLDSLHRLLQDVRPLTHTVEAFEALEALDMQIWEMRAGLQELLARTRLTRAAD